jgi:hypothetical protein
MSSYYKKVEAEKRDGDDSSTARWSLHKDSEKDIEKRRLFRKDKHGQDFEQIEGISDKKAAWNIKERKKKGDNDMKGERVDEYKTHTSKSVFKGFDFIDTAKLGGGKRRSRKKRKSKKVGGSHKKRKSKKVGGSHKKRKSKKVGGSHKKRKRD